ncbi:hypothetical protein FISHEDRAFT_34973 [Fistulina hepatica ATCC 64428]|uniref:DNA/RNA polymerase n=1 Tax=Fistulina hepatica ATCC 64428 TaxID=1128425 RepID=A0A0D7ALV1_9AGAR|nr:hypothetical protein FISHEDRAFT_34973 [Fistulina hepatica ATCC 64428]
MIPKTERSVHLDGLQQLGEALISARERHPNRSLVIWKSDVSHAYRILPMHPLWQIKQTIVLDAERRVNFDNDFDGGSSGQIWSVFFLLVLWIAMLIKFILDLFAYVDDTFSWDFADNLIWYEPYQTLYPTKQVILLRLWDELGVPHERRKQEWGSSLTIIGFRVDVDEMSITMPDQSRHDLIAALRAFAIPKYRRPLVEFQRLTGWVNWALNVYVFLRPGLNTLYAKIRNKTQPLQPLWVSKTLCSELLWVATHLQTSPGVLMLRSRKWASADADLVVFTDACPHGMSFYIPALHLGFQCDTDGVRLPREVSRNGIFYFEALAVVSAILYSLTTQPRPNRLLVWTDNTNTVDMFNSFHALPPYNPLLITSVDKLMDTNSQLRVLHVSGTQNRIADALSHFYNDLARQLDPSLRILPFSPPRFFYVVYMSHHIKPSSVMSYLSGICSQLEPFYPDVCRARSSNIVRRTLTGCLKLYSSPTRCKRPLHRCELLRITPHFATVTSFDDILWWSLLLTGFYGLLRLGELVTLDNTQLRDDCKLI